MGTSSLNDLYSLDPVEFERLVGRVFTALGYDVTVTKRSGDEGIDLELRRGAERSLAQCKRYRGTVGQSAIRDFFGVVVHENARRGYFVTTGQFSLAASTWAAGKPIALTDGVDLLAALDEVGLVPEPRSERAVPTTERRTLADIIEAALVNPPTLGRILIDGAPPEGHSYDEVFQYFKRRFPNRTDTTKAHALKGSMSGIPHFDAWTVSDATVRILDEFDGLTRALMERVLELQMGGIRSATLRARIRERYTPSERSAPQQIMRQRMDDFEKSLHDFVLVATAWEKRLPKAVRARFTTIIPSTDLDWSHMAAASRMGIGTTLRWPIKRQRPQ